MNLLPILTEKSLASAKDGKYTFWVSKDLAKMKIRKLIESAFDVHVTSIKTMNFKSETKRNFRGQIQTKNARKKAIVTLKDKEKIDLFEEKKK